eukprot:4343953-Pyramimonas_sp.AAC.1
MGLSRSTSLHPSLLLPSPASLFPPRFPSFLPTPRPPAGTPPPPDSRPGGTRAPCGCLCAC